MIGEKIAHYEVTGKLGEGGMGVVYRALDSKLNREVAIKVLPDSLTGDKGRMERFRREAQLLAQLNHPAIAGIHGVEESDGNYALVMELAGGQTLAERLAHGAVPVDEALPIARQIAEALEAAHEQGIIHRDLKPANIKITGDGQVKVLDFGLAKALEGDPSSTSTRESEHSPTLTMAATQAGVILGTAAYMSPEQARGRPADRRSDIWSFGVVFYEMLTANQMFGGETVSDSMAGVLKTEIDLDALPADTPIAIRRLLDRCLRRDRARRLQSIGDARVEIEEAASAPEESRVAGETESSPGRWRIAGIAAAAAIVAGLAIGWLAPKGGTPPEIPHRTFTIAVTDNAWARISPDGRYVLYATSRRGISVTLWLKDLETDTDRRIAELNWDWVDLCWSPDSRELLYSEDGQIHRYTIAGGQTTAISKLDSSRTFGMAWSPDGGLIVAGALHLDRPRLFAIPAQGGIPEILFETDEPKSAPAEYHPRFIPAGDGRRLLLYQQNRDDKIMVADLAGGRSIELGAGDDPEYSPTGHILYRLDDSLWAQPFSVDSLSMSGEPFLLRQQAGNASVSLDGTLVLRELNASGPVQLVWLSRAGRTIGTIGQPQDEIWGPKLSQNGKQVVVHAVENGNMDIWVHDTTRPVKARITSNPDRENRANWVSGGREIVYSSNRNGNYDLFVRSATGRGDERPLASMPEQEFAMDVSADGRHVLVVAITEGGARIFDLENAISGDSVEARPLLASDFTERAPNFSPDAKYFAYSSNETGREEVYIEKYPELGGRVRVSIDGGTSPRWRRDGKELFFVQEDSLYAVPVSTSPELTVGTPELLFEHPNVAQESGQQYDVSADGERFVVVEAVNQESRTRIRLIQNWIAGFKDSGGAQ